MSHTNLFIPVAALLFAAGEALFQNHPFLFKSYNFHTHFTVLPSHNFYDQAALSWLQSLVSSVYAFTPNTQYPQVIMMELMMNIYDYNGDDHDNPTSLCRI